MTTYVTMAEVRIAHRAYLRAHPEQNNWFDACGFFNTEIQQPRNAMIHGRYFITSDRMDDTMPRKYTIRVVRDNGRIQTLDNGFQKYDTFDEAFIAAAKRKSQVAQDGA